MSVNISQEVFFKHHHRLLEQWNKQEDSDFDVIVVSNGKNDQNKIITTSLNVWYFGYDLIDSILAFSKKSIYFIGSAKKLQLIEHFKKCSEFKEHNVTFIEKHPKDNQKTFEDFFQLIKDDVASDSIRLGQISKDNQEGPLHTEYTKYLGQQSGFEQTDCSDFISELFLIKDPQEITHVQKASKLTKYFFSQLTNEVEDIIDEEKNEKHSNISNKIQKILDKESEKAKLIKKYGIDENAVDFSYDPVVQSGGKYDLDAKTPNEDILKYDTIINSLGMTYNQYNANISRTFFIDPNNDQKKHYATLEGLHQQLLKQWVVPGEKLSDIYKKSVEYLKEKLPELNENQIPSQFGSGMGLYQQEDNLKINADCDRVIEQGMVFNIVVGIAGFKAENKPYAIRVADTLILKQDGVQCITGEISSKLEDISYSLNDDSEEEEEEKKENKQVQKQEQQTTYRTRQRQKKNQSIQDQGKLNERKQNQKNLRVQKQKEMKERLESDGFSKSKKQQNLMELQKLQTYKNESELPPELNKSKIYVDNKKNCLLLPINSRHVPININLIKNCSKQDEGQRTYSVRLNLHYPGLGMATQSLKFPVLPNESVYIRELTFKSKNEQNLMDIIKKIKDLQKKVKTIQTEKSNQDELAEHEPLQYIKGKRPVLRELSTRPNVSTKRARGYLECHMNGFRFVTTKHEICEINFSNIKHAFFQPCDQEMVIVIHFNLVKPILINKKKTYDFQVYTEAGMAAIDLNQRRRGYDEEFDDEEQEKLHRKKLNRDFKLFIKACQEIIKDKISFDKPYRQLGFDGAPQRATVFLQPTVNCLINVVETPPFVMTIEEVEIACFERMVGGLKNFDLVFVFKDYDKPVQKITAIPIAKAEDIKTWLNQMDIIFFESTKAIQWNTLMGEIKKDLEGFVEDGGWEPVLGDEDEAENEDLSGGEDSNFSVESEDESEEIVSDESEFSGSGSLVTESGDDGSESGEDDLSEEGLSWSEMEKKAAREDQQQSRERDEMGRKKFPQKRR